VFDKAKTAYERSVGKDNYMYSSMLNNIALLKNDMGDTQAAIEYTQEALDAVLGMESAGEEVATSYVNLSALYRKTGENGKALEAIEKALDIFRKMRKAALFCGAQRYGVHMLP
jgi:tetratricopeptide (TPR) repeat protein